MKLMREINVTECDNKQAFDSSTRTSSDAKDKVTNEEVFSVAVDDEVLKRVGKKMKLCPDTQVLDSRIKLANGKHLVLITEYVNKDGKIVHKIDGLAADASTAGKKSA